MVIKKLQFIFTILILFIPALTFSQSTKCKEARNECLRQVEESYTQMISACLISEPFYEEDCRSIGDTSLRCVDSKMEMCKKEAFEEYHKSTDACNKSYKNCRKGDIFGVISVDIQYDTSKIDEDPYKVGNAYVMISGFWKYQPKESLGYPKEYIKKLQT